MRSSSRYLPGKGAPKKTWVWCITLFTLLNSSGCTLNKVTLAPKQRLYAYVYPHDTSGNINVSSDGKLQVLTNDIPVTVTLKEDADALYITATDTTGFKAIGTVNPPVTSGFKALPVTKVNSIAPKYFFSTTEGGYTYNIYPRFDTNGQKGGANEQISTRFQYSQNRFYLQAMAIPLKFRGEVDAFPAQGTTAARPKIPKQVETGISLALAPGIKHSWNTFRGGKNAFGLSTTSYSIALGGLIGLGAVDINEKSTQGKVLTADASKNAIVPIGAHLVFGYNTINVGAAFGYDLIFGPNKSAWAYKGEHWIGVIVGLDIIK